MKTVPNPAGYGWQGPLGNRLYIDPSIANHFVLAIHERDEVAGAIVRIPNDQASAVALAILTAAGFVPHGNRADSDSVQESVDTAAGYLDDAVRIAAAKTATQADAKLLDREALYLARAWYDMPDGDWDDLNAITGLAQMRATRAAKSLRTQDEAAK